MRLNKTDFIYDNFIRPFPESKLDDIIYNNILKYHDKVENQKKEREIETN